MNLNQNTTQMLTELLQSCGFSAEELNFFISNITPDSADKMLQQQPDQVATLVRHEIVLMEVAKTFQSFMEKQYGSYEGILYPKLSALDIETQKRIIKVHDAWVAMNKQHV